MTGSLPLLLALCFLLLSLILRFVLHGYSYLAHLFVLIAVSILLYTFLPSPFRLVWTILLAAGTLLFLLLEIPVIHGSRTDADPGRKYLVVLGAEVLGTLPSRSLNYRLQAAQAYLKQYPESIVVVSGGKGDREEISEAECMARVLKEAGVDPSRIRKEDRSCSTMENLSFSFELIRAEGDEPDGNTAILSSSYHLCRARRMAALLGVRAAGVGAWPGNPFLAANFFIREAFGLLHLVLFKN